MKRIFPFFIFFMTSYYMQAQNRVPAVAGTYSLQDVREVASDLLLAPDHHFEFMYIYGAIDRAGKGTWETDKKDSTQIILRSAARPALDFALVKSVRNADGRTTIRITDDNSMLLSYLFAKVHVDGKVIEKRSDSHGYIVLPTTGVTKIELLFELCPERFSVFDVSTTNCNDFEFRFEPWIAEVFFDNIKLKITEKGLIGRHPLLKEDDYLFEKTTD